MSQQLNKFTIEKNEYLKQDIDGYYLEDYCKYTKQDYESNQFNETAYLNHLKNDSGEKSERLLDESQKILYRKLDDCLNYILNQGDIDEYTICVVPRAKTIEFLNENQFFFKQTVKQVVLDLMAYYDVIDGTEYIVRHTETKTTHLRGHYDWFNNEGDKPYQGISDDTCLFSRGIQGKEIILIDDIYTKNINIDEDMIQALLDKGAKSVTFLAMAKTKDKRHLTHNESDDSDFTFGRKI